MSSQQIDSIAGLEARYGEARPLSITKEIDYVSDDYRAFIDASPFMAVATSGPGGLDCSPRGDSGQVVDVVDPHTIRFPDRKGNNRLDTLRNLIADPRIALLFLVPGVAELMRVNGTARILVDPELLDRYTLDGKRPVSVIEVEVQTVYFQCSRAVRRSDLWNPDRQPERAQLPSCGTMLERLSAGAVAADEYDHDLEQRLRASLN